MVWRASLWRPVSISSVVLKLQPNNSSVHFNLAKALSDSQLDDESVPHHLRAIDLEPLNPAAWLNYGKSLDNLRKPQEALVCYENVPLLALGNIFLGIYYNLKKTSGTS